MVMNLMFRKDRVEMSLKQSKKIKYCHFFLIQILVESPSLGTRRISRDTFNSIYPVDH